MNTETATLSPGLLEKIAGIPFTATLTYKAKNPKDGPDRWICTLAGKLFPYSKGTALRAAPRHRNVKMDSPHNPKTIHDFEAFQWYEPVAPTALELLAGLIYDASCYEESCDIDDFAANFGGGKVSEIVASYEACAEAGKFLRQHFTPADLCALTAWAAEL